MQDVLIPSLCVKPYKELMLNVISVFSLLLAYVFGIVERTGAVNEEPFANRITDVPLTATCITIERDLRGMLGERDLPAPPQPVNGYLD